MMAEIVDDVDEIMESANAKGCDDLSAAVEAWDEKWSPQRREIPTFERKKGPR